MLSNTCFEEDIPDMGQKKNFFFFGIIIKKLFEIFPFLSQFNKMWKESLNSYANISH